MTGKVYLLGAGLGTLDTLTWRGWHILQQAEVLIYDALATGELVSAVSEDCLKLPVGKRGGQKSTPQSEINRLLVAYCSQGKTVVRLKSGDPLIFGRAREEIEALHAANCPFELVAGISSVLAAPLSAGIPLTDKYLSSGFMVISGHNTEQFDWQTLAQLETLVVLMGGRKLEKIVDELYRWGKPSSFPVAIIRNAGRPNQRVWSGTLADILEQVEGESLSPCVMVMGEVVSLQSQFQSSQPRPLWGKTVLVTRAAKQSSHFTKLLETEGARVLEMPALEIQPPSSWQGLDTAIAQLPTFSWLILTSANAVKYFFSRLADQGKDIRSLGSIKIAVVGKKTAKVLQNYHLTPDYIPPDFVADSLVEHFPDPIAGQKLLFPRVETGGREVLVQEITSAGGTVVEVPAYQSVCPEEMPSEVVQGLQRQEIDILTFASSKTVRNFVHLLQRHFTDYPAILDPCLIASIGPQTSQTCQELFQRVDIEAKEYTLEGLTRAITINN
ncbi:uroporphyrinogen-III C-methyltransferase [Spirulina sp. CS-785/01]|uniref:uroporphyrinogen-III C-methyltransferase n=1 Tax=Spirulina sp. CS-785/01 TaxID=3021716 RepID=UPI00232FD177|nr:uroporphyrinogen-III C-methyltransferase [Spirulina sp. CS-785/01]MDB9314072.1 uroporphyrinogen-III C-methyltransferase [Spirulina sp. CS-785/01]